ncbi:MAG: hypothetical protein N2319_08445 [Candidatus Kapabacteria bacterium]|nr:hypothetical protein [Candidatus Kapabacteria bacterium]
MFRVVISLFFLSTLTILSQQCFDEIVLDGSEKIDKYGIDSTGNWLAITRPYTNRFRLYVNGKQSDIFSGIQDIKFSRDGNRWACYAKDDGNYWHLLTNDTTLYLKAFRAGQLFFTPDSKNLFFTYTTEGRQSVSGKIDSAGKVKFGSSKELDIPDVTTLYISADSKRRAVVTNRDGGTYVRIGNDQGPRFDAVKAIGYWNDGSFIYAAKLGNSWEIYKNRESISEPFNRIIDSKMNPEGTIAAIAIERTKSEQIVLTLNDKYYEPLVSKVYDWVGNININPILEMVAFKAKKNNNFYVVYSNTEYISGANSTNPLFTYDGKDIYFVGCDLDCFVNINGRRYSLNSEVDLKGNFVKKSGEPTIAYTTSSALVIRNLEKNTLSASKMMDKMSEPIYNWKKQRYEALGIFGERLYFIYCK